VHRKLVSGWDADVVAFRTPGRWQRPAIDAADAGKEPTWSPAVPLRGSCGCGYCRVSWSRRTRMSSKKITVPA
jgi:hypothetical protein